MKTYKELMEETAASGQITGIMHPAALRNLKMMARQGSAAFQSTIPNVIARIELELNKFGYTLGELDLDTSFENAGTEDFVILDFATGDSIKNVFLTLEWEKLSSGQQYALRPDGSELRFDVEITVTLVDPADFETLLAADDTPATTAAVVEETSEEKKNLNEANFGPTHVDQVHTSLHNSYFTDSDGNIVRVNQKIRIYTKVTDDRYNEYTIKNVSHSFNGGGVTVQSKEAHGMRYDKRSWDNAKKYGKIEVMNKNEELEEAFRVKKVNRTLDITVDHGSVKFTVTPSGGLELEVSGSDSDGIGNHSIITIPKQRAAEFIDKIGGHYLQYNDK